MERLPQLAQLRDEFGDQVHTMTLNVDFDEDEGEPSAELIEKARKVLTDNQASKSTNLLCQDKMGVVFEKYQILSFPTLLVFQNGELKEKFEGEFSHENDVVPAIHRLLRQ